MTADPGVLADLLDTTRCPTCEDAEFLLLSGELLEQVGPRLRNSNGRPFTLESLQRHLHRHGRPDLAVVPT